MIDLFAAAGIDLGDGGRGGRPGRPVAGRTLRVPLLNYKVVAEARKRIVFDPTSQQLKEAASYAKVAKSPKFAKQKETAVRNLFIEQVLGEILGYAQFDPEQSYTIAFERPIRRGAVDVALGRFGEPESADEIVAPFELKGPGTTDLDAIMPGRGRRPVQQAWDYAIDAPGSRWVLVSNCVEIRLYGFGRGRDAFELFDLTKLDDPEEHARLWMLLSAGRLLGGSTDILLRDSESAYKDITNDLYVEYKALRDRLIAFLTGESNGPKLAMARAIELAQKVLDRILFIAFAEHTDLLPSRLLERALSAHNEFLPEPIWKNFQALFREVDGGNEGRGISAYNGGLFAIDPVADVLVLPDALVNDLASLRKWDYGSDVPVTVLGHIFEQSITDLEKLRAESRGEAPPKVSKRKREGVVYTPEIVTRFLVEHTIGKTLEERFAELLARHGKTTPESGATIFADNEQDIERAFWRDYSEVLRGLRIVDPACGSGAFLVAAFDRLAREYRGAVDRLTELGESIGYDPFDEIVTKNLYGVDLNAESVEITRLALWLRTARNKHQLQNLEATIKVGNSLIDDNDFTQHPFDWRAAFPEVFAEGGFDLVIGNPPYVRMELIKPIKPYLEKNYVVAADRTDLYAFFFERGVDVLKEGGRLGYISSSSFFRTGSGENLRKFLGDHVAIEALVDFGDLQVFEGVTTYPAIITLRKGAGQDDGSLSFLKVEALPKDLDAEFSTRARTMPRARLGVGSWQLEDDALATVRDKIVKGKKTLGEVYGAPLYGIKTGLNRAFIVSQATRDRLVAQDSKSSELLIPYLQGDNIKRWHAEPDDLFLINTPKGKVDINAYPAVREWLLPFKAELEARATKQQWFELQQAQFAYQPKFKTAKIVYVDIANSAPFAFDDEGTFIDCTVFMIPGDSFLLAFLNSKAAWFQWIGETPIASGGYIRLKQQYIAPTALPAAIPPDRLKLSKLGEACTDTAKRRFELLTAVRHRILADLTAPEQIKLSRKLEDWWKLDFAAFRDEVKRVFHTEIPVKERAEWEVYLAENASKVLKLSAEIEAAEREINTIVYRLFDLTDEEVRLLEASIEE